MMRHMVMLMALAACASQSGGDVAAIRAALTSQRVAALQVPMILVETSQGAAATLLQVGRNGPVTTWQSRDGVQISTHAGVVVASRGFGHDLMSSDLGRLLAVLRQGGGTIERRRSYLDGNFGLVFEKERCVVSRAGRAVHAAPLETVSVTRYVERCNGAGEAFMNQYDIDDKHRIWTSRQWISAELGYLTITLIRP